MTRQRSGFCKRRAAAKFPTPARVSSASGRMATSPLGRTPSTAMPSEPIASEPRLTAPSLKACAHPSPGRLLVARLQPSHHCSQLPPRATPAPWPPSPDLAHTERIATHLDHGHEPDPAILDPIAHEELLDRRVLEMQRDPPRLDRVLRDGWRWGSSRFGSRAGRRTRGCSRGGGEG